MSINHKCYWTWKFNYFFLPSYSAMQVASQGGISLCYCTRPPSHLCRLQMQPCLQRKGEGWKLDAHLCPPNVLRDRLNWIVTLIKKNSLATCNGNWLIKRHKTRKHRNTANIFWRWQQCFLNYQCHQKLLMKRASVHSWKKVQKTAGNILLLLCSYETSEVQIYQWKE